MRLLKTLPSLVTRPINLLMRGILQLWIKPHWSAPGPDQLQLDPTLPVLYVLPRQSYTDRLVLEHVCRQQGLPDIRPLALGDHWLGDNLVYLERPSRRGLSRRSPRLTQAWELLQARPQDDLQVVPVSLFWGRAPGREHSVMQLITVDSWSVVGRLRRLLRVIIHGRQLYMQWGQPLRLREVLGAHQLQQKGAAYAINKSSRLLGLYFRRVRTQVLGPDLSHRRTLVKGLLQSPRVKTAIETQAQQHGISEQKAYQQAERYALEIASNVSYPVIRLLDRFLNWLWNRLYDGVKVHHLERLKNQAGQHTLVYVPCHRSHIDYLLLSYVLFEHGLMTPHIAAGINLDMPVIGPLLRRGGAFFMRRSFRDNPLYSTVFNEYLYTLFDRGHPVEYFIEGGRSRTGRTLAPRPGMLAMTLRAALRGTQKPLVMVPVYIGYEHVLEGRTYLGELQGKEKRKESPLDLFRVLNSLRKDFGQVNVTFGEPLHLERFMQTHYPQWRQCDKEAERPDWLQQAVPALGHELAIRINQSASLNPVALVALALLASPHRALEESVLIAHMQTLVQLQRQAPLSPDIVLPEGTAETWLSTAEKMDIIERVAHPMGDIIRVNESQGVLLTWYRNNVLHLFALPGLIAYLFMNQRQHSRDRLQSQVNLLYPVLQNELFLPWQADQLTPEVQQMIQVMRDNGLLVGHDHQRLRRPPGQTQGMMQLRLLGQLVQPALERGYLLLALLDRAGSNVLTRDMLVEQAEALAHRLAILQGLNAPEYFDARLFRGLIDAMIKQQLLYQNDAGNLSYDAPLRRLIHAGRSLFDPRLRHSILQLAWTTPVPDSTENTSD